MLWTQKKHEGLGWRTAGDGAPIILLRGLGRWSEHWCGFDDLMTEHGRVYAIDNRGFGLSRQAPVEWNLSVDQLADDVATILRLNADDSAIVVGVSLGGMLAISLAARYPHLVKKLVLINSSVGGSPYARITRRALSALKNAVFKGPNRYERLADVLLSSSSSEATRKKLSEAWSVIDERHGLRPVVVLQQLLAAARFKPGAAMASIKAPTLVIKGAKDQFIDPRNSDWIADHIPQSRLIVCESGGHELGLDQPQWLCQQIKEFMSSSELSRS